MKLSAFVGAAMIAAPATHVAPVQPPSAAQFAKIFATTTNAFSIAHHDARRISHAHCVGPAPGRYMCVYLATKPPRGPQCHLMQARWTPTEESTITVTLSGRTRRCRSVREAIDSLR